MSCILMRYGLLIKAKKDELLVPDKPANYMELIFYIESKKWFEAIKSKMNSMSVNQIWTFVNPLEGIKPIGY